jgi:hypothetical protein
VARWHSTLEISKRDDEPPKPEHGGEHHQAGRPIAGVMPRTAITTLSQAEHGEVLVGEEQHEALDMVVSSRRRKKLAVLGK